MMDENISWKVGEGTWMVVRNANGNAVAIFKYDEDAVDYVLEQIKDEATCSYEPKIGRVLCTFTVEAVYLPDMAEKLKK